LKSSNRVETLLDKLAVTCIAYEPGDVLTAAAAAGICEELKTHCTGNRYALLICTRLAELAQGVCISGFSDFTAEFSAGADLLRSVMETGGRLSDTKRTGVEAWLAGTAGAPASPVSAAAPAEHAAEPDGVQDDPGQTDPDQLQQFVSDCSERLTSAQELALRIEADPSDADAVRDLFRVFHTIKGECGFLKLNRFGMLAHNTENLLDGLRSGARRADRQMTDILLEGLDRAREFTEALKKCDAAAYAAVPSGAFIRRLSLFMETGAADVPVSGGAPLQEHVQELGKSEPAVRKTEPADTVIKIKTGKVSYLTDMIGELLISLGQMDDDTEGLAQVRKTARLLQYAGMQLRTESVHVLFGTVRRIIRDTSQKVGKSVLTVFEGEDLEIDRTLTESLEEPLMHLVRNALDHGIESAQERLAAGKAEQGTIRIAAERRGNTIVLSVGDDGRGLDRERILHKALEKNLIRGQDCSCMTDAAVHNLIFVSGFSTNEKVDQISGRGVGMDIVKEAVSRAKGRIVTESTAGKGTTFSLYFPLSTAIIDGMLTRTGKNIFIIPIASIVESLKVKKEQLHKVADKTDVLDLRGRIFPVLRTAEIFGIQDAGPGDIATIVEDSAGGRYALINDELIAKREVVIKSLGPYFKQMQGISSGTVLQGGTVGYVLDVDQIIALGVLHA